MVHHHVRTHCLQCGHGEDRIHLLSCLHGCTICVRTTLRSPLSLLYPRELYPQAMSLILHSTTPFISGLSQQAEMAIIYSKPRRPARNSTATEVEALCEECGPVFPGHYDHRWDLGSGAPGLNGTGRRCGCRTDLPQAHVGPLVCFLSGCSLTSIITMHAC